PGPTVRSAVRLASDCGAGAWRWAAPRAGPGAMTPLSTAAGVAFAVLGALAERLASVWPADEAARRSPGLRTLVLALGAGLAGGAVAWRSSLPLSATLVYLAFLAVLVLLAATDLEQR